MKNIVILIIFSFFLLMLNGCALMHGAGMPGCGGMSHGSHDSSNETEHKHKEKEKAAAPQAVCPVCKMEFEINDDTPRTNYKGKLYYFDSEEHLKQFINEENKSEGGEQK